MKRQSRRATRSAFLVTCSPLALPVLHTLSRTAPQLFGLEVELLLEVVASISMASMVLGGVLIPSRPRLGVPLGLVGLVVFLRDALAVRDYSRDAMTEEEKISEALRWVRVEVEDDGTVRPAPDTSG